MEATITKFEEIDPDISGKSFMDIAQDSDSWFNQKINDGTVESFCLLQIPFRLAGFENNLNNSC